MSYGVDGWGSIFGRGKRLFSTPQRPDRLWSQPSLKYHGYRRFFPQGGTEVFCWLKIFPKSDLYYFPWSYLTGLAIHLSWIQMYCFGANRTGNTTLPMTVCIDKYSQFLNVLQSEVVDLNEIFLMLDTNFLYDESSFLLEKQFRWSYM
jgi:hypothetical protein